ncbi:MAG: AsmA family protein [Candidatus Acidiferrales bacterium]
MNKKKILIAVGVVVALLIVIILALPLFVNANQFKPQIESNLTSALGRQVSIGNLSLAIFSGGVTVDDVSVADDPAFSSAAFLQAKQLTVGVELLPLIFSKRVEVRSFSIDRPSVTLLKSHGGVWNFSTLGSGIAKGSQANPAPAAKSDAASSSTDFSVQELKISDGTITVGAVGSREKPSVYQNVDLDASDLSYTTQFPFKLTATGPGSAAIKLDGKAGPINRSDMAQTPLDAQVDVEHLDLATTGFVDASSGIGGLLDFTGSLSSDGRQMTAKGTVKTTKLKMSATGSPSSVPVNVDYATTYDVKGETGTLTQGNIHVGKALATLTGTYNTAGETTSVQMKLSGQAMPVPDLEGVLPAVGVALPSGSSLKTGTLDANLTLSGPVDKLTITGPINLANAKLSGFNLGAKLAALQAFTGKAGSGGSDTEIQKLSADVRVDPSGTHAQNLNIVVPTIGTITGNGNVSASGQLDCSMVAQLAGAAGMMTGAAGQLGSGLGGLLGGAGGGGKSGKSGGIPFKIQGTTSNPIFIPDVAAMAGSLAKGGLGAAALGGKSTGGAAAGVLGGLLGKKKPQ